MELLNDWHDYVRVLAFFVNLYTLFLLVSRFHTGRANWNQKTIDLWYALSMWTLTGCVFAIQGIALDRPFTVGFVFLTTATLVGGKGVHAKGKWGGSAT